VLKRLQSAVEKETQKAIEQTIKLAQYSSYEDAQEAYGYGNITFDEFERVAKLFEGLEEKPKVTAVGAAHDELAHFISRLRREIRGFEWEMLPDEEKERIERETEERHAIIEIRRGQI
jgi:Lhr-like helicase